MTQRTAPTRSSTYQGVPKDLPLSLLLFRYVWPFWLFKDASHGDQYARAAAYSHNRHMRIYLPGYLLKWTVSTILTLAVASGLESLSSHADGIPDMFVVMAAIIGMLFAAEICLLLVTAYIYLYLSRHTYLH